jgi:hypothetical protein
MQYDLLGLCHEMRDEVRTNLPHDARIQLQRVCRLLYTEDPGPILPLAFRWCIRELREQPAFRLFLRDWHTAGMHYGPPVTRVVDLTKTDAAYSDELRVAADDIRVLPFALAMEWDIGNGDLTVIIVLDTPLVPSFASDEDDFCNIHAMRFDNNGCLQRKPRDTLLWMWMRFDGPIVNGQASSYSSTVARYLCEIIDDETFHPDKYMAMRL